MYLCSFSLPKLSLDALNEKLEEELYVLENAHKGETAGRVLATILAQRECQVELRLTYRECMIHCPR